MRSRKLLGLVLLLGALASIPAASSASNDPFFVGFADIAPEGTNGATVASTAAALGATAVRFTLQWAPGESALTTADAAALHQGVANTPAARILLSVYGRSSAAPTDATGRAQYCAFVKDALTREPRIRDVVVWNEPNKAQFWSPQAGAPAAYVALLAACYDTLHAAFDSRPLNILGLALSHDGNDTSSSTSPGAFIRNAGTAYRNSGRTVRIFDTVAFHPYPVSSAERPWAHHVASTVIGEGDWNKLMNNLSLAFVFDGSHQPIPGSNGVSIWYTELGFQTTVPQGKAGLYTGTENVATIAESGGPADPAQPADSSPAPDQATQVADAIALAACQPYVQALFNFLLVDEVPLAGWQSGALYPDLSHKASYPAFQAAIGSAATHAVDCASLKGGQPSSDYLPPTTAANVVATSARSPLAVTITWTAAVDAQSAVSYRVYRGGTQVGTSTTTSFTDGSVAENRTYSYTVRAIDSASNLGAASLAAEVTTDVTAPTAPGSLSATPGSGSVALTWPPATDDVGVTGYELSRNGSVIATLSTTSYIDSVGAGTYSYAVVALDAGGNRSAPATATVTVAGAPPPPPPPPPPPAGGGGGGGGSTPNLGVAVSASAGVVVSGGEVDLRATVTNTGDAGSLQTHLIIQLPAGVTLLGSPAYERGSGCEGTTTIDCFLDYVPNGGVTHVYFNVSVAGEGGHAIALAVSADRDSDNANNSASISITVPGAAAAPPPAVAAPKLVHVRTGTARADRLRGTGGIDRLYGRAGNDTLTGLAGNDLLDGGSGRDLLDAGAGNDTLRARDGQRDVLRCGPGRDTAVVDRRDVVSRACEIVRRA